MPYIYFLLLVDVEKEGPVLGVGFVDITESNEHVKF